MNKDVIQVTPLDGTRLQLTFEGNEQREIDIAREFPMDGVFAALRDPAFFRQVRVEPDIGTIVWPNGADVCPDVLYQRSTPVAATPRRSIG